MDKGTTVKTDGIDAVLNSGTLNSETLSPVFNDEVDADLDNQQPVVLAQ